MWDLVAAVERGQLIRVKPGGVAFNSSELVDEEVTLQSCITTC